MANVCIRQAERIPANDQDDKATLARALEVAEALARVTRLFGATSQDEQCRPGATSLGPLEDNRRPHNANNMMFCPHE